ncbi:MAG: radical SAM protein [Candidatus Schekmanbacteria bacterium]|nr:MAG: radical SAM protein [Candidatus Schekmanbacteria bacterium]
MPLFNWFHIGSNYLFSKNPLYLIFQITSRCNSRCLTCFNWKILDEEKGRNDLSLDEIEKISENYGPLLQLTIGGGEPFLRDDIDEICFLFSKNNSVQHITIPTNALLPEKVAEKIESILKKCHLNYLRLGISLDAIGERHDRIRGVVGNYEKAKETYRHLLPLKEKYENFGIEVSSVFSALNKEIMKETIDIVKEEFTEIDKHAVVVVRGDARNPETKEITADEYADVIGYLYKREEAEKRKSRFIPDFFKTIFKINTDIVYKNLKGEKWPIRCLAGKRLIIIKSDGEVLPCEILDEVLGNLRDNDYQMDRILNTDKAKRVIKKIKETQCSCTFECAVHASLIFNFNNYPHIFKEMLKQ